MMIMRKCWEVGIKMTLYVVWCCCTRRSVGVVGWGAGVEGGGWLVDGRLHKKLARPHLAFMCWMLPVASLLSFHCRENSAGERSCS